MDLALLPPVQTRIGVPFHPGALKYFRKIGAL